MISHCETDFNIIYKFLDLHELIFSESATDFTPPVNGQQEDSISNSILMSDTSDSTSTESSITYPSQTPESNRIDESVTQKRKGYNPKYYVKENTYNKVKFFRNFIHSIKFIYCDCLLDFFNLFNKSPIYLYL